MLRSRPRKIVTVALGLGLGLAFTGSASAATWGSFNAARIAYAIGPLTGDNHAGLRALIEAHGDTVASGTAELTAEYLGGVDVFYTAMLSDGTGPTAGMPGTLSEAEAQALQDWVAAGGTLVVTADSNGFDGPWTPVYDSFTQVWGVAGYQFFPGEGTGAPTAAHAITKNVTTYSFDGSTTFVFGIEGEAIGGGVDPENTFIAVFEPATGFDVGGRVLLLGDHNMFTEPFLDLADNETLAQNVIAWAAGDEPGGGSDTGTDSSGGADSTTGDPSGTSSGGDDTLGTTGSEPPPADGSSTGNGDGSSGPDLGGSSDGTGTTPDSGDADGCGCRASHRAGRWTWLALGLFVVARRKRRPRPVGAPPT